MQLGFPMTHVEESICYWATKNWVLGLCAIQKWEVLGLCVGLCQAKILIFNVMIRLIQTIV